MKWPESRIGTKLPRGPIPQVGSAAAPGRHSDVMLSGVISAVDGVPWAGKPAAGRTGSLTSTLPEDHDDARRHAPPSWFPPVLTRHDAHRLGRDRARRAPGRRHA